MFRGFQELQSGFHIFQHGEMLILRIIYLFDGNTPDDLLKKITKEEKTVNENKKNIQKDNDEITVNKVLNFKKILIKKKIVNLKNILRKLIVIDNL